MIPIWGRTSSMYAGDEFGEQKITCYIVSKALFGQKSGGAFLGEYVVDKLDDMVSIPLVADLDIQMRPAINPDDD